MEMQNTNPWPGRVLRFISYVLVAALASCTTLILTHVGERSGEDKLDQLQRLFEERYIGQIDQTALLDGAAAGMVEGLGDRWAYYVSAEGYDSYYADKKNSYVGVGITITMREDDLGADIIAVTQGGPAEEAGILPGDILHKAEGQLMSELGTDGGSAVIRGEEGTNVNLTLLRPRAAELTAYVDPALAEAQARSLGAQINTLEGIEKATFITAQEALDAFIAQQEDPEAFAGMDASSFEARYSIILPDAAKKDAVIQALKDIEGITDVRWDLWGEDYETLELSVPRKSIRVVVAQGQMLNGNIGYIKIANFNSNCASETIACIEELVDQGAEKLIFDVRNNGGGYKDEMVDILDYLLPEGDLFRGEDYSGAQVRDTSDAKCLEMPMGVLINESSYSAAELFAAALEEYEWAITGGSPSTGKARFQNTFRLSDGSAVAFSVGAYYTPKGVDLEEQGGLVPQVNVPVDDVTAAGIYSGSLDPEDDPQLQALIAALEK